MSEVTGLPPGATSSKPGFFYGYVIAGASFVILMLCFGVSYSFGVFFKPILTEFGWTRAVTSAGYSLSQIVGGLLGIPAGKLGDILGPRKAMFIAGSFLVLGCLLMSQITAVWQLYLFFGVLVAAGVGSTSTILFPPLVKWFTVRRGLIAGIVVAGIGTGTLVFSQIATRLISAYDWRTSYIILGIGALVLIAIAASLLKRPPETEQAPDDKNGPGQPKRADVSYREALGTSRFWLVGSIFFLFGFGIQSVMVHIVAHAIDLNISAASAATILSTVGGMSIAGRIAVGSASDRIGIRPALFLDFIILVAALLFLQAANELWQLYLFAIFFGFAYGGGICLQALVPTEMFGVRSLGLILGSVLFLYTTGGAIGPVISGYIFDVTSSYRTAFLICSSLAALGLALTVMLARLKPATRHAGPGSSS